MGFFDFLNNKSSKQIVPTNSELNTKIYEQLITTQKELTLYQEHGTSDPVVLAQMQMIRESMKSGNRGDQIASYQVSAAFSSIYTKVAETRKKLIREVDKISQFYIVDVIISQLTEDSLTPQIGTGDIILMSSDHPEIQNELDYLDEKFDIDQLISTIVPDLIRYGEYTLKTELNPNPNAQSSVADDQESDEGLNEEIPSTGGASGPPNTLINYNPNNAQFPAVTEPPRYDKSLNNQKDKYGLIDLHDTIDQGAVIALTKWTSPEGYLVSTGVNATKNPVNITRAEAADYVKFSLQSQKIRIDIFKEFGIDKSKVPDALKNIPKNIRVGKSMIYGIISKLKELELLEALVPATKLSKLSNGTLVGVTMPAGYDIAKAIDATKQIEGLMNKKIGVDPILQEITIENIMGTAGRLKAVPIFGDTGKLQKLDYKQDEPDELLASVEDIRKVICSYMGIPYDLIFGEEESMKATLQKQARYLRKLKSIQKSVEEGIRQIIYIHLANKGVEFNAEDIKVEFYNKLIEINNLDKLEFMDTTVGLLKNIKEFVLDIANPETNPAFADKVDLVGFYKFINEQFNVVGFHDFIMDIDHMEPGNPIVRLQQAPLGVDTGMTGGVQPNLPNQQPHPAPFSNYTASPAAPKSDYKQGEIVKRLAQEKSKKFISMKKPEDKK
jgi:hypothetical protein